MRIAGMSGNEIYCLLQKGYDPGEIVVGNSVVSMGVVGGLKAMGKSVAGGEITPITELISEGRHKAIERMEAEAKRDGAMGVTGVDTRLGRMAGFTEFLSQGTGIHPRQGGSGFFSTAASGMHLYCQLDTGYQPRKFVMGNIAYALGVGRGLVGGVRTLARGEVKEYSSMYNDIRHTALRRLRQEAAQAGANAVVDVNVQMLPYGPGTVELLMTGTASHHDSLSQGPVPENQVVTSELSGEELWNLAKMGYAPLQLVMATSVYSLGVAGGIGASLKGLQKGELPEVTQLIYQGRENALELIRKEAKALGAIGVVSTSLQIREISSGLVEIVALGTAIQHAKPGMEPQTPQLIPQALILDRRSTAKSESIQTLAINTAPAARGEAVAKQVNPIGCIVGIILFILFGGCTAFGAIFGNQ